MIAGALDEGSGAISRLETQVTSLGDATAVAGSDTAGEASGQGGYRGMMDPERVCAAEEREFERIRDAALRRRGHFAVRRRSERW